MTVSNGQLKVPCPPLTSSRVGVAIPLHGRSDVPGCLSAFYSSLPAVHFRSVYPSSPPCMGGGPASTSGSGICEVHPEWPPMRISDWVSPLASDTVSLIQYGFSPPLPRGYRRVPRERGVHEPDARSLSRILLIAGPADKSVRCHPEGADWKMAINNRLVLSTGRSVNDGIESEFCSLSYTSVDHVAEVVAELGIGALLAIQMIGPCRQSGGASTSLSTQCCPSASDLPRRFLTLWQMRCIGTWGVAGLDISTIT